MNNDSKPEEKQTRSSKRTESKRTTMHPSMKTKKGIRSWIKGDLIRLEDRDEGWEYRWCDKTNAVKMAQREAQGFVRVTSTSGHHVKNAGQADINHSQHDGPSTSGLVEMGDLILMALDKELAEERRQAVMELNQEALEGMSDDVDSKLKGIGAPKTGDGIKIEVK